MRRFRLAGGDGIRLAAANSITLLNRSQMLFLLFTVITYETGHYYVSRARHLWIHLIDDAQTANTFSLWAEIQCESRERERGASTCQYTRWWWWSADGGYFLLKFFKRFPPSKVSFRASLSQTSASSILLLFFFFSSWSSSFRDGYKHQSNLKSSIYSFLLSISALFTCKKE